MVDLNLNKLSLQLLNFLAQVRHIIALRTPETLGLFQQVQCVTYSRIDRAASC
jgi:hypothetical protein